MRYESRYTEINDQNIHDILNELYQSKENTKFESELYGVMSSGNNLINSFDKHLIDSGLIYKNQEVRTLTEAGIQVCKEGGWLAYKSREAKVNAENKARQKAQDDKLMYDARISKYLYKTRWWPLIISIASGIVALFALFKS